MSMKWCADSRLENRMDNRAAKFSFVDSVPVADLDPEWRKRNPGRPGDPILESSVYAIAGAVEQGFAMPPVILFKTALGYGVADGHQRLATAIDYFQASHVAAYVLISPTQQLIEELALSENAQHGEKPPIDWLVDQALDHGRRYGITDLGVLARIAGVGRKTLEAVIAKREVFSVLEENGINTDDVSKMNGHLLQLHRLKDCPKVLCQAFNVTRDAGLKSDECKKLVDDILRAANLNDKCAVVRKFKNRADIDNRIQSGTKHGRNLPYSAQVIAMLRGMVTFLDKKPDRYIATEDKQEIHKLAKRVLGRLKRHRLIPETASV